MRILHVEHPDAGGPGTFGTRLSMETWRAWREPPPEDAFDAIVVYGGEDDVADAPRLPWLRDELAWLRERLDDGVPVLGLCLGGQLIAAAMGAEVTRCAEPQIGWYETALTAAGRADPVLGVLPERFLACQWHRWQFAVPKGGELLAADPACAQAFRHGRAWGLQFHPEVDGPTLARWNAGAPDPAAAQRGLEQHLPAWNALGLRLFEAFIAHA